MHSAAVRYDVIRAWEAGLDAQTIQRLTGVPPRSQRRIVHEEIPFGMSDDALRSQHRVGRPSSLSAEFRECLDALLTADPRLKVSELLRRLRSEHGYPGGKNPVYAYVAQARPRPAVPLPVVRFEGVAGEFAQFDFGTLPVTYADGSTEKLTFFAGRLKYSRALHVVLVAGESTEAFLRGLEACARAWGGLPLFNVVDNTKAAVLRRLRDPHSGKETIRLNPHFAAFLQEVGVFAEPTYPYSGQQKGSVENLVRFVKEGFLTARRFRHRADLEAQLAGWLHYVHAERPSDATGERPALRLAVEQPRLRPVPYGPQGYGLAYTGVVGRDGRVRHGGYAYSAPPGWLGQTVLVRVHPEHVVLHYEGGTVSHPRRPANGKYSLLPEHRPALFVKPRGQLMAQRQILMDLCPEGEAFFTELVHRRPHTWREQDLGAAWALYEREGDQRLVTAFQACVRQGTYGAEYLRAHLEGWAAGAQRVQEVAA